MLSLLPVDASLADDIKDHLLAAKPAEVPVIVAQPGQAKQGNKLTEVCRDNTPGPTDLVADYAAESPEVLTEAIQYASDKQFDLFYPLLEKHAEQAVETLTQIVKAEPESLGGVLDLARDMGLCG